MPPKAKSLSKQNRPANYKQQTLLSHFSSSPPPPASSKPKSQKIGKTKPKRVQGSESDVELVKLPIRKPARRERRPVSIPEGESDSGDVGKIKFERHSSTDQGTGGTSEQSSLEEPISPSRPTKRKRPLNSDSDSDDVAGMRQGRLASRRLVKRDQQEENGSQSESDAPQKRRSRLVKGKRPASAEEGDDPMDGIDEHKIVENRLRGQASRKSRYMQNLEKLKKKKLGVALSESEEEASEEADTIPGARLDGIEDEDENHKSEVDEPDEEEEVNDFIVDDEGEAQTATLPAIFSMNTHQDLIHHFKIVCQYLVHLAVTAPAARTRIAERLTRDEYFSVPLSMTRRKLADLRDSLASSVWRPAYKKALLTYPEFNLHVLDFAIPQCDACHLGGRLSKFVGRLSGDPYDSTTFQSKAVDTESSDYDSDNERERSATEFNLGRFCAQRTEIFHELSHWEYQLFLELSREVEELSNSGRGFVKVAYAGAAAPPDDVSDADQIMEWLDQRGIINAEWLKIKQVMSRATNLEADAKRGKGDD